MSSQPPMGGHLAIPQNGILYTNVPPMSSHLCSTLSSLNLPCHLHSPQAANCCRTSRLVVNEADLNWVTLVKNILLLLKQLYEKCRSKTVGK